MVGVGFTEVGLVPRPCGVDGNNHELEPTDVERHNSREYWIAASGTHGRSYHPVRDRRSSCGVVNK